MTAYVFTGLAISVVSYFLLKNLVFNKASKLMSKSTKNAKHKAVLVKKEKISPDTYIFQFSF